MSSEGTASLFNASLRELDSFGQKSNTALHHLLQPFIRQEDNLRKTFASNGSVPDPYSGLIDVFQSGTSAAFRTIRARHVDGEIDLRSKYVMPLSQEARRATGDLCMVPSLERFRRNWSIFTEEMFDKGFDWSNVLAAGGSILACLLPDPTEGHDQHRSRHELRQHFHQEAFPTSDIDLFLWGMSADEAKRKLIQIFHALRSSVPYEITCVRTRHAISIISQYPFRVVQIVLRLYQSPSEILAGFDIDAACCAYDGKKVWANPRALSSMISQCLTVDMTRRSPSYETRLTKYASRGFEIHIPTLERENVNPVIYSTHMSNLRGLGRLLYLERFISERSKTSPVNLHPNRTGTKCDLKSLRVESLLHQDSAISDYESSLLRIPYGPGWNSKNVVKLLHDRDFYLNSADNSLHRHPYFFGDIEECLEDCCGCCPDRSGDESLDRESSFAYVSGPISFIAANPSGQTRIGSFNPISIGEWSDGVYNAKNQEFLRAASVSRLDTLTDLVDSGADINATDEHGRSAIHYAILNRSQEVINFLLLKGTCLTGQMDFRCRTPLHLAAETGDLKIVNSIFAQVRNQNRAADNTKEMRNSLDTTDSFGLTPLCYAVLSSSLPVVKVLLNAGCKVSPQVEGYRLPLSMTLALASNLEASNIARCLLENGATAAVADKNNYTIFHRAVTMGKLNLVSTFLKFDVNASYVLDFPAHVVLDTNLDKRLVYPLETAASKVGIAMFFLLYTFGAKPTSSILQASMLKKTHLPFLLADMAETETNEDIRYWVQLAKKCCQTMLQPPAPLNSPCWSKFFREEVEQDVKTKAISETQLQEQFHWLDKLERRLTYSKERKYLSTELGSTEFNPGSHFENIDPALNDSYARLYEASYLGKCAVVDALCKDNEIDNNPCYVMVRVLSENDKSYYTPLFAALSGGHSNMVKVLFEIAIRQSKSYVDYDRMYGGVGCPDDLLTAEFKMRVKGKSRFLNLVQLAILKGNVKAFLDIADLYDHLPNAVLLFQHAIPTILEQDSWDMLSALFKRFSVANIANTILQASRLRDDSDRCVYFGLKDRTQRHKYSRDPRVEYLAGLVFNAAASGANDILSGLENEFSVEEKEILKTQSLENSPIFAAIRNGRSVATSLVLLTRFQCLLSQSDATNLLLLGIKNSAPRDVLKLLIDRGASIFARGVDRFNVLHLLALNTKIPEDLRLEILQDLVSSLSCANIQKLLFQTTRATHKTPVHCAIESNSSKLAKAFLEHSPPELLRVADSDGSIPLHYAAVNGDASLINLIIDIMSIDGLRAENVSGRTALDLGKDERLTLLLNDPSSSFSPFEVLPKTFSGIAKFLTYPLDESESFGSEWKDFSTEKAFLSASEYLWKILLTETTKIRRTSGKDRTIIALERAMDLKGSLK